jgi:hypothetical protein
MPATAQQLHSDDLRSTDPFSAMRAVNRSKLSKGSKVVYTQLRISAGHRGTIQYRIAKLAEHTDSSETSLKSYLSELKAVGLVIPQHRLGRSNVWYVFDPSPTWDGRVPDLTQAVDRPHPGDGPTGGGSAGRPHENVLRKTYVQNVENVPGTQDTEMRVPEADDRDDRNVENVVKSWPSEQIQALNPDDEDSPVRAPDDLGTHADVEIQKPPHSSDISLDPACATGAACTPSHPALDPEKVEETSADSHDQACGEHLPRGRNIPTPNPDKIQETSAKFEDPAHPVRGDRGDSPMRVPGERTCKVFDSGLLREILDLTGDHKSKGCWISCVSRLPEEEIRIAMSSLRQAMMETDVYRPGGYMLGIIKSRNPEFSFSSKGKKKNHGQYHDDRVHSTVAPPMSTRTPHVRVPVVPPSPPEPPPPSIEDLVKGWRFASRSISIPRLLEIMKTSIGDVLDPSALWSQVKDLCPGKDERTVIDRFLEVVTTRLRHHASQAKVT